MFNSPTTPAVLYTEEEFRALAAVLKITLTFMYLPMRSMSTLTTVLPILVLQQYLPCTTEPLR